MADVLHLTVLSPAQLVLDVAAVNKVRLKLADDMWLSIYPHHLPLVAETLAGPLTYVTVEGEQKVCLAPGIVSVTGDVVTVFTSGSKDVSPETPDTPEAVQEFDRLAHALFATLGAHPEPQ